MVVDVERAVGRGLEVVEQPHARTADGAPERQRLDVPGQIGDVDDAAQHRPGDAERRRGDALVPRRQERLDHRLETRRLAAGDGGLAHQGQLAVSR